MGFALWRSGVIGPPLIADCPAVCHRVDRCAHLMRVDRSDRSVSSLHWWTGALARAGQITMLYDQTHLEHVRPEWARRSHWHGAGRVERRLGGRGGSVLIRFGASPGLTHAVLRRYQRGGWVAHLSQDRYVYNGLERTRALREFRLLDDLHQRGLAVPRPLLASVERFSVWGYRQALMTQWIDGAQTLAQRLAHAQDLDWPGLARTLAQLLDAGVYHPDLNAHNVLCDDTHRWWVIDFDRARIGRQPRRGRAMITRLCGSLTKLGLSAPLSRRQLLTEVERHRK